jgi:hypothetical protein
MFGLCYTEEKERNGEEKEEKHNGKKFFRRSGIFFAYRLQLENCRHTV